MRLVILLATLAVATAATAQTEELLISEYVEGTGDNNALEIFNGTADTVNLSGYAIERYSDGAITPVTIPLDAVELDPGHLFVLAHTGFASPQLADQFSADLDIDGNDALVLSFNGQPVDRVGRVGEDPGTAWSCALGSTRDHTLRRLAGVCEGSRTPMAAFDPCDGWEFFAVDTFDGLGEHNDDCGTVPLVLSTWGSIKSSFR